MEYANVSVKFPQELDTEIERFLEETGVYTNKSEFIKEAVRRHLRDLNRDPAISALRLEQLLAQAEQDAVSDEDLHPRLADLQQHVDHAELADAVETARESTADEYTEQA